MHIKKVEMKHMSRFHSVIFVLIIVLLSLSLNTCIQEGANRNGNRGNAATDQSGMVLPTYIEDELGDIVVDGACDNTLSFKSPWMLNFDSRQITDTIADGIQRILMISARLDTTGQLHDVKVAPCGNAELERLMTQAFSRMRCTPALKNGAAVSVRMSVPLKLMMYNFKKGRKPAVHDDPLLAESLKRNFDIEPTPVGGMDALIASVTYPRIARKANIEGDVAVLVRISEKGTVEQTGINWSKYEIFEASAVEAIKRTAWKPALKNGRPVAAAIAVPFRFTIPRPYDVKPKETDSCPKRPE